MSVFSTLFASIFRDYSTPGMPASGAHEPVKAEIRQWGLEAEAALALLEGQNLVINGDLQLNQRNFAGGAVSAGVYGRDRWKGGGSGGNYSVSSYTVTLTSGSIVQVIEPSVWGLASFASLAITISVEDPDDDVTVTFGSQSDTIAAGSGRQSVTLTLGAGDTGNLSLTLAGTAVTFARVKLEVGSIATAWRPRPLIYERFLAWRYYWHTYPAGVTPGHGANQSHIAGFSYTTDKIRSERIIYPVRMRTTPSVTCYAPSGLSMTQYWAINSGGSWIAEGSYGSGYTLPANYDDRGVEVEVYFPSTSVTINGGFILAGDLVADAEL